jgi:hypothetical protein
MDVLGLACARKIIPGRWLVKPPFPQSHVEPFKLPPANEPSFTTNFSANTF